jgi:hypothetical protein
MNAINSNFRTLAAQTFRPQTLTASRVTHCDAKEGPQTSNPSDACQDLSQHEEAFLREMLYFDRF